MKLRWENYFVRNGEACIEFWNDYFGLDKKKRILFILGIGWDLRCCIGLKIIMNMEIKNIDCLEIKIDEGLGSPSRKYESWVEINSGKIRDLVPHSNLRNETINIFDRNNNWRIGSKETIKFLRDIKRVNLHEYTDIILDVSALPRCIFFPLITEILQQIGKKNVNFFILVSENSELDKMIQHRRLDENMYFFPGFGKFTIMQSLKDIPRIWIPILGEDKIHELDKIYGDLGPEEVCPMLPFPAENPRRCDDLVREYREFLFDRILVEPRNFIYATEDNPFDVYRQIIYTSLRYNKSLEPLGGGIIIISPFSSKLMTIGAAMAAYELRENGIRICVSHVGARGYSVLDELKEMEDIAEKSKLFSIWLTGECFD